MDVQITCICPPKDGEPRHEQDTVTLPDRLPFRQLVAIRQNLGTEMQAKGITQGDVIGMLLETYVLTTPVAWSVVDEKGAPLPLSRENVAARLLADYEAASAVGEAADGLYSDLVTLPLRDGASSSSPGTPTPSTDSPASASTSPTNGHGTKRRKPSKPSSTTTSPMVATGPMPASPSGDSSFSAS